MMVDRFLMSDYWDDEPEVKTLRVVHPNPKVDNYYFWLYWDNKIRDRTGFSVADLNKHLLAGHLSFKLKTAAEHDPFITVLPVMLA